MAHRIILLTLLIAATAQSAPSGTYADWAAEAFGARATQAGVAGRSDDPDGDGRSNFAEYVLGSDPTRAESGASLWWHEADELRARFSAATAAREGDVAVKWSSSLNPPSWGGADGTHMTLQPVWTNAAARWFEARLAISPTDPSAFAQIEVIETPLRPLAAGWVWFEAEPPNGEANGLLSGGQMSWIGPGGSIQKTISVASPGTYTLWVRKFWNPQTFRWRTGSGDAWKSVSNPPVQDLVDLGPGRKVGWINAGEATLSGGLKTFRLEVTDAVNTTAYDCFLLTREAFSPRGKAKPGEPIAAAEDGWFSFQPEADRFDFSAIDLRRMNEGQAGDGGFVAARGAEFVHGATGEPVRFWAVNTGLDTARRSKAEVDLFARTMAKKGVNLVRIHGAFYAGSGALMGQVNMGDVNAIQYLVASLKREGIYSCLSIYFPLWVTLGAENTAFPGYTGQNPFALLYFNDAFQTMYRGWWQVLLTSPNPHTGVPLRDEPAVAMAEMVNEDSMFFWTFNPEAATGSNIPGPQRAIFEKKFGDWLLRLYPGKTLNQIVSTTWGGVGTGQDNLAAGRVGFRGLWAMFNERLKRDQDTARFLAELQLEFYGGTYRFLRETLGFKAMISASNWTTASPQYFGPLDKWSNASADFLDRHGYFGGVHTGDASGYSVQAGQKYNDRSALRFQKEDGSGEDFSNPLFDVGYAGKPSTISEVNWTPPNRYRADYAIMAAALGASQGSDAIFHFAAGAVTWEGVPGKFSIQTPVTFGQFPAAALIFRKGLLAPAPSVVSLRLSVSNLFALKGAPLPALQNFDQLRGKDVPPGGTITNASAIDLLSFVAGHVAVDFTTNAPSSEITDLSPQLNRPAKTVRNLTGEFEWDWARGIAQLRAPGAQGVTGHLQAGASFDLPAAVVQTDVEFGSIILVSLDDRPLDSSEKILLQVMSEEKPWGWTTDVRTGLRTIQNAGQPPMMVRNFDGTVRLKRTDAATLTVTPLDFNGYRTGKRTPHGAGLPLDSRTLYYLIEK